MIATKVLERPPSLPALTGLRFFAAFGVLLFHYGASFAERSGLPAPLAGILHNGNIGVSLFFVLSGFILSYSHQHDELSRSFFRDFYIARFARIYPVYILALLLALIALRSPLSFTDVLKVLSMTQAWGPVDGNEGFLWVMQAWTLSVELFFYLSFPLVFVLARSASTQVCIAFVILSALCIVALGTSTIDPGAARLQNTAMGMLPLPIYRWLEFVFGCFLWRLKTYDHRYFVSISRPVMFVANALSILAILAFTNNPHWLGFVTVLIGILIIQATSRNVVTDVLASRAIVLLGGASYAIYILQGPVREICRIFFAAPFDSYLSPIFTIGAALIVFQYWEKPARRAILNMFRPSRGVAAKSGEGIAMKTSAQPRDQSAASAGKQQ